MANPRSDHNCDRVLNPDAPEFIPRPKTLLQPHHHLYSHAYNPLLPPAPPPPPQSYSNPVHLPHAFPPFFTSNRRGFHHHLGPSNFPRQRRPIFFASPTVHHLSGPPTPLAMVSPLQNPTMQVHAQIRVELDQTARDRLIFPNPSRRSPLGPRNWMPIWQRPRGGRGGRGRRSAFRERRVSLLGLRSSGREEEVEGGEERSLHTHEMGDETTTEDDAHGSGKKTRTRVVEPRRQQGGLLMGRCNRKKKPLVPVAENGGRTTVMIRNIPNKYTRELLIQFLDKHCRTENQKAEQLGEGSSSADHPERVVSAYDFLYLPLDLRRGANLGYAFVNFTDARAVWKFFVSENNQRWELFCSRKIRQLSSARLQGNEALVKHFENTLFACDSEDFLPVVFSPPRDGSGEPVTQKAIVGSTFHGGFAPEPLVRRWQSAPEPSLSLSSMRGRWWGPPPTSN